MKNLVGLISMAIVLFLSFNTFALEEKRPWYHGAINRIQIRGNILGYALINNVEDSDLNPFNIIGIPGQYFEGILRPDISLSFDEYRLWLACKPRASVNYTTWEDGVFQYKDSAGDSEAYVNEWQIKYGLSDSVFIVGGRENLQWGPSYVFSPSNPFLGDNGRNNPYLELPGLDYLRAVWIPSNVWSFSIIANVGEGRREGVETFRNTYAYKVDVTGYKKYASAIVSKREKNKPEIGFFGGITATDYLLFHLEGSYALETDKLDMLVGGSYTLKDGSAFTLEYFYQGSGCTKEPIERCIVSEAFYSELQDRFEDFDGTIDELIDEIEDLDLRFDTQTLMRKNYLMAQYIKPNIRDTLTLTARWIYDVDDTSSRVVGIGSWSIKDRLTFIFVGNLFAGETDTEFGSLLNHSFMLGATYSF